ncbi:hypothetical protein B7P43_G02841 [Cryptotermes secundus]|uniref:Tc1-like transposase DDE domain-containing protein n=1 Tax=Cryptotermes secundus TaxID=105785 RepID=A0A2J7QU59_9NEOP|nr:hypothetical protein B7P43_G02841 [Cryptotermes secundus]
MQDDEKFVDSVIFSDESTFHASGKVNTHNCRIWGSENPRVFLEHVRDSPKTDEDDQEGRIHFQQEGAPPHYLGEVREYLNTRFPVRWIGRAAPIAWSPRSPGLTPVDVILWGFFKDRVLVPPLPANVVELRTRITASVAEVTPEMLRSVWQETD